VKVRIVTITNVNYRAQMAVFKHQAIPNGSNNTLMPQRGAPGRVPQPVFYRVQYRGFLRCWFHWQNPIRSLVQMAAWNHWHDTDFGDDDYDTYEQALRAANHCWQWMCLQARDPNRGVVEYAPGAQESLYDQ